MNEYYGYPENDWRNYLMHASGGHKYISKHRGKSGKWIYVYQKAKGGVLKGIRTLRDSPLTSTGRRKRKNANEVLDRMYEVDDARAKSGINNISKSIWEENPSKSEHLFRKGLDQRNKAWASNDATRKKKRLKEKLF